MLQSRACRLSVTGMGDTQPVLSIAMTVIAISPNHENDPNSYNSQVLVPRTNSGVDKWNHSDYYHALPKTQPWSPPDPAIGTAGNL